MILIGRIRLSVDCEALDASFLTCLVLLEMHFHEAYAKYRMNASRDPGFRHEINIWRKLPVKFEIRPRTWDGGLAEMLDLHQTVPFRYDLLSWYIRWFITCFRGIHCAWLIL